MSPLLTASELSEVQKVAELGMVTPVTIYRRTPVAPGADYYDDRLTYVLLRTVNGWLHSQPTPIAGIDADSSIVTTTTFRLFLPVGTDILPGDRVVIGSRQFTVSDTTAESTWPALLAVSLRGGE